MTTLRIPLSVAYNSPIVDYSTAVDRATKLSLEELVHTVKKQDGYISRIAYDAIIMKQIDKVIAAR